MNVESGSLVDDDNIKANLLGKTFSEVFINDVKYNLDDAIRTFDKNRYYIELDMDDIKILEFMVVSKLKNLNVHKSAGNDNVYPKVLRECCNSLVKFLHILYNKSLMYCCLPNDWKISIVSVCPL